MNQLLIHVIDTKKLFPYFNKAKVLKQAVFSFDSFYSRVLAEHVNLGWEKANQN